MQKNIAIYPGTFDPITKGHVDIVERSARLFSKVIVAIGESSKKKAVLSTKERLQLAKKILTKYPNVDVCSFSGLLVDCAQKMGATVIIRGLRAISDFEYEFQMADANRHLNSKIETIFLTPTEQYSYISSSLVREIAEFGGDISSFVHEEVKVALKKLWGEKTVIASNAKQSRNGSPPSRG
jgi:pantetheine-phosphate adenylyltransferase